MKLNKSLVAVSFLALTGVAWAANKIYSEVSSAGIEISAENGGLTIVTTEVRYLKNYLYAWGSNPVPYLVKATIENSSNTNMEGIGGQVQVEVRSATNNFAKPVWTLTDEDANNVEATNETFVGTVQYGCCGASTQTRLYAVENGQLVANVYDTLFTIEIPNSKLSERYVARVEDKDAPEEKNGKQYIGTLGYFESTGRISKARIYADVPAGWGANLDSITLTSTNGAKSKNKIVHENRMQLWDSDSVQDAKKGFSGFAVTGNVSIQQDYSFTIPVNGDAFEASQVKGAAGLEFEVL